MKTNFLPKSNSYASRNKKRRFFAICGIVLFLILISFTPFFKGIVFAVGKPIWYIRDNIVSIFIDNQSVFKSKLSLIAENNSLKTEINSFERDRLLLEALKKENDDLKGMLNRTDQRSKRILSVVLVKPFLSPYDTLIIDLGSKDGISVGDKVIAFGTNFIGYISEVYDNSSKVTLYSSFGEKVKVLIGNGVEKEAFGIGGGNFRIEMPREADIKEGDPIYIPSISPNVFAVIEKVETKENDSFESVLFKNTVNMSELKWVEVILQKK